MTSPAHQFPFNWIESQQDEMISLLEQWASINSGSHNTVGLAAMAEALTKEYSSLKAADFKRIPLHPRRTIDSKGEWQEIPLGDALLWQKNPQAQRRVLLGGHMDTVFPADSPFQKVEKMGNILRGPGTADMKGGLVILLKSLQALEQRNYGDKIGWDVIINPDEEIGSPGSEYLFAQLAKRNQIGLLFEPSPSDGTFVSARKGSSNWTVVARGRSAHVGRDFPKGRNALIALAKFLIEVEALTNISKGIAINIGYIEGGGPVNIIPDLAIGKFNIRIEQNKDLDSLTEELQQLLKSSQREGIELSLYQNEKNPTKPFDPPIQALFAAFQQCAKQLGIEMNWKPSGGACDGSRLYAEGLPNIDTLGVVGGQIHTHEEYALIDSLTERTKLTTLFLILFAEGELDPFVKGESP